MSENRIQARPGASLKVTEKVVGLVPAPAAVEAPPKEPEAKKPKKRVIVGFDAEQFNNRRILCQR